MENYENTEKTEEEKKKELEELLAQRKVIQAIIEKGIKFSVSYTVKVRQKGLFGIFKPKVYETRTEEFTLHQATLDTLDRATVVKLNMKGDFDEFERNGSDVEKDGDQLVVKHSKEMAECLAIMVLGEKYNAVEGGDEAELQRLTDLFYKTVTSSQYLELENYLNATRNVMDFLSSMRLTMMSMTTTPTTRIE